MVRPAAAIAEIFSAWEAGDAARAAAVFAEPDGVYEDPLLLAPLRGRDQIETGLAAAMAELRDCRIATRALVERGDLGLVEAEFRSELVEGGRLDFEFAMAVELRAGEVLRLTEYFDTGPLR